MVTIEPTTATIAAAEYMRARTAALEAFRAVRGGPSDRDAQATYGAALSTLARWFPSEAAAHVAVGQWVASQEAFELHIWHYHAGVADDCSC